MARFWASVQLVGLAPLLVLGAIALTFLVFAVLAWRRRVWRWVLLGLFVVAGLVTAADVVNTKFAYYDDVAQLLGIPNYPVADLPVLPPANGPSAAPDAPPQPVELHPEGAVTKIHIPDTESHFGQFDANVWLPPQYFSDPRRHFPVIILAHGNPGTIDDWLAGAMAAQTGLVSAQAGQPVILVSPAVLQNALTGDSLCVDSASQGNAETYLVKDVVGAVDRQLRTNVSAQARGIGGFSMGGFCALNLGLKHPDVFSVVLDFSGETSPVVDTLPGGLEKLFGPNWQQQADANNPTKYYSNLDPTKGPAIWMESGSADTAILKKMQDFAPKLKAKGFTVELHTSPGGHDFTAWTAGLREALPWAAARLSS